MNPKSLDRYSDKIWTCVSVQVRSGQLICSTDQKLKKNWKFEEKISAKNSLYLKFVIGKNVTMFDKLLIRMCTFGVIWLTNWNSKLENKYKKNKGEKAVEFHYSPPSQFQIEEIITEKCSNKTHELGRKLGRVMNGHGQEKEKIRIMENTNDSLGKSLTTLSWLTTVNVDELRKVSF